MIKRNLFLLIVGITCNFYLVANAHEISDDHETVIPLQRQALVDMPGKNGVVVIVEYGPGQVSTPHFHPGSVFAYVLEGEVVSQLEGQPITTYKAGDSWYEPPRAKHLISKNASATKPAKLLVWLLVGEQDKTTIPLDK